MLQDAQGNALPLRSVHIANTDTSAATTWSARTGGISTTADQVTDSLGAIPRWIEEGSYLLTALGETLRVEATAGGGAAVPSGPAGGDLRGTYPDPLVSRITGDEAHHAALDSDLVLEFGDDTSATVLDSFASDTHAHFIEFLPSGGSLSGGPAVSSGELVLTGASDYYDDRALVTGDVAVRYKFASAPASFLLYIGRRGDDSALVFRVDVSGTGDVQIGKYSGGSRTDYEIDSAWPAGGGGAASYVGRYIEFKRVGNTLTGTLFDTDGTTIVKRLIAAIPSGDRGNFGASSTGYAGLGAASSFSVDDWSVALPDDVESNIKRHEAQLLGSDASWRARDIIATRFMQLPAYTTATQPSPIGLDGVVVFVSDAASGSKFQGSDGSAWVDLG